MSRATNFYAGPSVLPVEVFQDIADDMVDYQGTGLSLIETSHRSKTYDEVHNGAVNLMKELFSIPENYKVLFLGGGATLQFSMIPLNFLNGGKTADFTLTGTWSKKAADDAAKVGKVNVVFDGKDSGYSSLADASTLKASEGSQYFHMTSNETIGGIQWKNWPETGNVPLICDMSSDILSRPVPIEKFGMIYAGAQKNLGPAGATVVIIRDDLLEKCPDSLTAYLNYSTHAKNNSLYNTPPVFPIYAINLVLTRMKANGGLKGMVAHNKKKSDLLYNAIDSSKGYYRSPVDADYRSDMNVVFRLPSEDLENKFIKEATALQMFGLKGHRSVGGCRASIYNSMTIEGVETLTSFMKDFASKN
jgi:phosphoserine aminotransferase